MVTKLNLTICFFDNQANKIDTARVDAILLVDAVNYAEGLASRINEQNNLKGEARVTQYAIYKGNEKMTSKSTKDRYGDMLDYINRHSNHKNV